MESHKSFAHVVWHHRVPKDRREYHQGADCVATIHDEFKVVDPPVRRFSGVELEDLFLSLLSNFQNMWALKEKYDTIWWRKASTFSPQRAQECALREHMTKIVFETLNVPATYVANQADSFLCAALAPPTMFLRWYGFKVMLPQLQRYSLTIKRSALFISTSRFGQSSSPLTFSHERGDPCLSVSFCYDVRQTSWRTVTTILMPSLVFTGLLHEGSSESHTHHCEMRDCARGQ